MNQVEIIENMANGLKKFNENFNRSMDRFEEAIKQCMERLNEQSINQAR